MIMGISTDYTDWNCDSENQAQACALLVRIGGNGNDGCPSCAHNSVAALKLGVSKRIAEAVGQGV